MKKGHLLFFLLSREFRGFEKLLGLNHCERDSWMILELVSLIGYFPDSSVAVCDGKTGYALEVVGAMAGLLKNVHGHDRTVHRAQRADAEQRGDETSELLGQRSCQSLTMSSLNLQVAAAPCRSCPTSLFCSCSCCFCSFSSLCNYARAYNP